MQKKPEELKGSFIAEIGLKSPKIFNNWGIELFLRSGYFFTNDFALNLEYSSLVTNNIIIVKSEKNKPVLQMTTFGLAPEYMLSYGRYFLISLYGLIGLGTINYANPSVFDNLPVPESDWIFLFEPSFGVNYRIYKGIWFDFGFRVRAVSGVDLDVLNNKDLSGWVIQLG